MDLRIHQLLLVTALTSFTPTAPHAAESRAPYANSADSRMQECLKRVRHRPNDHLAHACIRQAGLRTGTNASTLSRLREARLAQANDPLRWYFEGRALLQHEPNSARSLFRSCNETLPANAWCLLGAGLTLERQGEFEQALGFIQHARTLEPTAPSVIASEIRVRTALKEFGRARLMVAGALKRYEDHPEVLLAAAKLHLADGLIAESREAISSTQTLAPDWSEPFALLGQLNSETGAHESAADNLQTAVSLNQRASRYREALARELVILDRTEAALDQFAFLHQLKPESIEYMVQTGEVHLAARSPQRALGWADSALRHRPRDQGALELRSRALITLGKVQEGLAIRPVLYADPIDGVSHRLHIASALASTGNTGLAEAEFTDAVRRYPKSVIAWTTYADWYLQKGSTERAEAVLRQALGRMPDKAELHAALAATFEAQGHLTLARQAFSEANKLKPQRVDFTDNLARLEFTMGDTRKAVSRWEELLERAPRSDVALRQLATAYTFLEQHEKALAVLKTLVRRYPAKGSFKLSLGETHLKLDQRDKAIETLRSALEMGVDETKARALLATALADSGYDGAARQTFETAIKKDPTNRPLRLTYAYFCEQRGDTSGAVKQYKRQLARNPIDAEALAGLNRTLGPKRANLAASSFQYPAARQDAELAFLVARIPQVSPDHQGTVLRDERYVRAGQRGVEQIRHVRSVLIQTTAGAKRYKEVTISFHAQAQPKILRARTLTPDGESIPVPVSGRRVETPQHGPAMFGDSRHLVLTFESLEPGSVLDYEVITYRPHPDLGKTWWDSYILGNSDPTVRVRYELELPRDVTANINSPGLGPPRSIVNKSTERLIWERTDLPSYRLADINTVQIPGVYVSSMGSWSDVDAWYTTLFEPQSRAKSIVLVKAQEIAKKFSGRVDRIAAVYRFVEQNIRYLGIEFGVGAYKPRPAESTLAQGQGDCKDMTALMVALLRELGIEAFPALVRPSDQGVFLPEHPSPGQFGHVLLYIPHPTGDYWLDATAGLGTVDSIPQQLRGQLSLIVDGEGGRLLRVPSARPDDHKLVENRSYELNMTGGGEVLSNIQLTGDLAGLSRQKLLNSDRIANESFLSAPGYLLGRGFIPDQVSIDDLEQPTDPLHVSTRLQHRDLVAVRLDGSLVISTDLDVFTNGLVSAPGVGPIVETPRTIIRSVTFRPPAGYRFNWEPIEIDLPGAIDLRVTEERQSDQTTITTQLTFALRPKSRSRIPDILRAFARAQAEFRRELVMSPGEDFSPIRFLSSIAAERPDDPRVLMHLGRELLMEQQPRESLIVLRRAIDLAGDVPEVWALTAAAHIQLGELDQAVALLQKVTQSSYSDPRLYMTLAFLYTELGQPMEALDTLSAGRDKYPKNTRIHLEWINALGRLGKVQTAADAMEKLADQFPEDHEIQKRWARLVLQSGQAEQAENILRRLMLVRPQDAELLNNLAWLLREDPERRAEGIELARRAVHLAPQMGEAWDTLAELYFLDGQMEDALMAIDRAVELGTNQNDHYELRREKILRAQ